MLKCFVGLGPLFALQACWYEQAVGCVNVWGTVLFTLLIFLLWTFCPLTSQERYSVTWVWHPAGHTKRFAACRLLMETNRQCVWRNHAFGKNQGQFTQRNFHLMSCSCWVIWLAVLAIWQGHPQAQYCGSSPCYGTYVLPEFFLLPFRWQLMLIFDLEVDLLRCLFVCFWFLLLQSRLASLWLPQICRSCAVPSLHSRTIHGKSGQENSVNLRL